MRADTSRTPESAPPDQHLMNLSRPVLGAPVETVQPPTPMSWRLLIAAGIMVLAGCAYLLQPVIGTRGQAVAGVLCFFGVVAIFSANLRAVNWHTIAWGIALQILLALLVLKVGAV